MRRGLTLLATTSRLFRTAMTSSLLALAASLPLSAQGDGDVFLDPEYLLPMFVGVEAGYTMWKNEASFAVSDQALPCAVFGDADGQGPGFGARSFLYLNPWLFASPRIRFEARPASFIAPLAGEPVRDASNAETILQQEAQADMAMSSLTLDARVGIDIMESGLYVAVGPGVSLMLEGSYDYSERILGPSGFLYSDTRSGEHMLVDDRAFENFQSIAVDLRGGAGYLLQLDRLVINPEVFYSFPVTSSLKAPDKLKQTGISGSLGILYNFGE